MNEFICNTLLHLGWACFGQECDCEAIPNFNWVARTFGLDAEQPDEEAMERSYRFRIGCWLVDQSNKFNDRI